jgi:hypothetical protein
MADYIGISLRHPFVRNPIDAVYIHLHENSPNDKWVLQRQASYYVKPLTPNQTKIPVYEFTAYQGLVRSLKAVAKLTFSFHVPEDSESGSIDIDDIFVGSIAPKSSVGLSIERVPFASYPNFLMKADRIFTPSEVYRTEGSTDLSSWYIVYEWEQGWARGTGRKLSFGVVNPYRFYRISHFNYVEAP